jgi:hypothetical protein
MIFVYFRQNVLKDFFLFTKQKCWCVSEASLTQSTSKYAKNTDRIVVFTGIHKLDSFLGKLTSCQVCCSEWIQQIALSPLKTNEEKNDQTFNNWRKIQFCVLFFLRRLQAQTIFLLFNWCFYKKSSFFSVLRLLFMIFISYSYFEPHWTKDSNISRPHNQSLH